MPNRLREGGEGEPHLVSGQTQCKAKLFEEARLSQYELLQISGGYCNTDDSKSTWQLILA